MFIYVDVNVDIGYETKRGAMGEESGVLMMGRGQRSMVHKSRQKAPGAGRVPVAAGRWGPRGGKGSNKSKLCLKYHN